MRVATCLYVIVCSKFALCSNRLSRSRRHEIKVVQDVGRIRLVAKAAFAEVCLSMLVTASVCPACWSGCLFLQFPSADDEMAHLTEGKLRRDPAADLSIGYLSVCVGRFARWRRISPLRRPPFRVLTCFRTDSFASTLRMSVLHPQ